MPLSLLSIHASFGSRVVLHDLSLDVAEGEWVAVVGANGSGRTTLALISAGLRRPQHGQVRLDNEDIWGHRGAELRRRLGLVMQRAEDQFLGDTVRADVAFGPQQTGTDPFDIASSVNRALERVGFDPGEVADRSPLEFSGGQRRRLAIAGILALDPKMLVLDEPFSGLDGEAREDVRGLLRELRDGGLSVLSLGSDLASVEDADRMALLIGGAIGLSGDMNDFVANQRLCREAGILLPEQVRLALALRERGWNVPVLGSPGALESAIAREWRQRQRA